MKLRAHYHVSLHAAGFVCIVDEGRGKSITNDAEAVVAELLRFPKFRGHRIVYRDNMGRWDELLHSGGAFTGFRALPQIFDFASGDLHRASLALSALPT